MTMASLTTIPPPLDNAQGQNRPGQQPLILHGHRVACVTSQALADARATACLLPGTSGSDAVAHASARAFRVSAPRLKDQGMISSGTAWRMAQAACDLAQAPGR